MTLPSPSVDLLGIRVNVIDPDGVLREIARRIGMPGCALIHNVNVHACNLACENPEFRRILNESAIVFCDGFGVKLGARLLGLRLGKRMTPPDWIDLLLRRGEAEGWSFYFLGDEPDVLAQFEAKVRTAYPALRRVGRSPGFFEVGGSEEEALTESIRSARPDVILTAMGMPRQELWADRAKLRLDHGVVIATGALFRWYTGRERRAPKWMSEHGGEELYRLLRHPVRHFRRYFLGVPCFFFRVMKERFHRGTTGGPV